jgi:hypothetical protein
LTANNGRESLWVYLLTPFVATFGARPFGLRLAAIFTGVLTLAAFFALGRQVLRGRGAIWAAAALCVLYWHVQLSHMALRANLFLLIGTLALTALLRAERLNRRRDWALAGLGTGLLAYTYFSADLWAACIIALLAFWILRSPQKRTGAAIAALLALVVLAPMAVYAVLHPSDVLYRATSVQKLALPDILQNVRLWAGAWLKRGDPFPEYNIPGRPILDHGQALLLLLGIASLPFAVRDRSVSVSILVLALVSLFPSLISDQAPHTLRASGLVIPLALMLGAGAWGIERLGRRFGHPVLAAAVPLVVLAASGLATSRDFTQRWLNNGEVFTRLEAHINRAVLDLKRLTPPEMPVYFSPLSPSHPVVAFRSVDLSPRRTGAFDSHYCLVIPDEPAAYVSLTLFEPEFQEALSRWADLTVIAQDEAASPPRYTVYVATPRRSVLDNTPGPYTFGDALELRPLSALPASVHPGDVLAIDLGLRALRQLDRDYSAFVHLYGNPTPYEGGQMWSQGDSQLHPSYPPPCWRTDETFVQRFYLPIPADLPSGRYTVAVGLYESPSGPRLPVTAPEPQPWDYVPLGQVEVLPD